MQYSKADLTDPDEREAFYAEGSDRAIAILLGAIVERRLYDTLKAKMVSGVAPSLRKDLFKSSGALGSFRVKNEVGYIFGIVPLFLYNEIDLVVDIRNAFAHKVEVKDFTSPTIVTAVSKLETMKAVKSATGTNPKGSKHVSGIELGKSLLGDYRLCVASYISALRGIESGRKDGTGYSMSYFD